MAQGITFDTILIGYLGSLDAIRCACDIIDHLLSPDGIAVVDPAMADHGKLYSGFDEAYASAMYHLCQKAHIIIPNITEAAMLSGNSYQDTPDPSYIEHLMNGLPCEQIILTGVSFEKGSTGVAIRDTSEIVYYSHPRIDKNYHGTGDIFAATFVGSLMQGCNLLDAAKLASDFTCKCIENTYYAPAHWYGVKFETALPWLIDKLK